MPISISLFIIIIFNIISISLCCTTFIVGKKASKDGSVMCSHSDDGKTDARLIYVPAYNQTEKFRNVYYDTEGYPRYIGYDRGPSYYPTNNEVAFKPIGQIPQVPYTYARYEATYGIMNEHQVGIAESTCSGIFSTNAVNYGGNALLSIDELSRIALERCDSSRCSVLLMGELAVKYGFYGADSGREGGAESLMVTDPNEGFIFHILPDDTGTSAIWVAQRIKDDEVAVVANMFVIRGVNLSDSFNFLGSDNMYTIAKKYKLWPLSGRENELLDFTATFSDGEYGNKYYSGRRVWGAFGIFAPSIVLPDNYTDLKYDAVYPVSIKPDLLITPEFLMKLHANYYQNTTYDMTRGLAAGPWGAPDRWETWTSNLPGAFERSIGIQRTAHTSIVQSRSWAFKGQGAILWFGPDKSATTSFIPLSSKGLSSPPNLMIGNPNKLSRQSTYWACRYTFNIVQLKYYYMIQDVNALQAILLNNSIALVNKIDNNYDLTPQEITDSYNMNALDIFNSMWTLPDLLIEKYADGYNTPTYPNWWLTAVGYQNGPPPPPTEPTISP